MSSSLKAAHRAPAGRAGPGAKARHAGRELGFLIADAARLLRTYTDQRAREIGTTRAQWAVLNASNAGRG